MIRHEGLDDDELDRVLAAVPRGIDSDFEKNVKSRSTWLRLLFMAVFLIIYAVSRPVVFVVVVIQFFWILFTSEANKGLLEFGQSLATYTYQIVRYLTFNSEEKPFPFDQPWPAAAPGDTVAAEDN